MSDHSITLLIFAATCAVLFTVPFVPALREWLRPTDSAALSVPQNLSSDIDYFARRLHADAQARLGRGDPTGYEAFDVITPDAAPSAWAAAPTRLLVTGDVAKREAILAFEPAYVDGSLQAGAESAFSSVYATQDLTLGERSRISDWAHAGGILRMGRGGSALRRVSAGQELQLAAPCWFERLHAPSVRLGHPAAATFRHIAQSSQVLTSYATVENAVARTEHLYLVQGDCTLREFCIYRGSLVVTGGLTIGSGTTVAGDVKARGGVILCEGAVVQGAITCEQSVHMQPGALALGPVACEGDVLLCTHTVVGLPDALTTVSGRCIVAEDGVTVHGTVWAHEIGMIQRTSELAA